MMKQTAFLTCSFFVCTFLNLVFSQMAPTPAPCAAAPTASPYVATNLPTLTSADFSSANVLSLTITADYVANRQYFFAFANENGCVTSPDFHNGSEWTWNDASCQDVGTFAFPWSTLSAGATASPSVASNCGFNVYILEDVIVYNGTLLVTQSDTLASIRSQTLIRNTTSPLSLSITFPRYAAVNASSLTIFAPIDVEAAIVVQDYDVTTDSGLFQMLVSVEYPFKFSSVTMRSSGGAGINVYPSIADSQEGYQCLAASEDCSVLYDLYVNGTFCALSGFFAVEFGISCRSGVVNCPLQGGENANVTWTATSTNLC
jgi:hypothetical protein